MPNQFTIRTQDWTLRFWSKVQTTDTCWLWQGAKVGRGYGVFWRDGQNRFAHRLSYELAYGAIPSGLFVCHTCDVRDCVRPSHLWLGTCKENLHDASTKGRMPGRQGTTSPTAKLNDTDVVLIRHRYADVKNYVLVSKEFHVSETTIRLIIAGKTWKHIA